VENFEIIENCVFFVQHDDCLAIYRPEIFNSIRLPGGNGSMLV